MREAEKDNSCSPWVIAAIRLLTFTGARRNEILTLRWEHVSEEHECLVLPTARTAEQAIDLNAPVLGRLQVIPRLEGNLYVFAERGRDNILRTSKSPGAVSARLPISRM